MRDECVAEERIGIVVEETIRGCAAGCCEPRVHAMPSVEYGEDVFHDLTAGLGPRQHTGWEEIEGRCPGCDCEIDYRRMFVVTAVVRTTTVA